MNFFRRRLIRWSILVFVVCLLAFLFRRPLLAGAAWWWVVSDPPAGAAAIVVLGGGPDSRPFAAARLYKEGYAPKILLPKVKPSPTELLGLKRNDTDLAREVLLHEGIPGSAIELIGADVTSTFDETGAVLSWLKSQPGNPGITVIIPTETFFTRRTKWIFTKTLKGMATPVVVAIPAAAYTSDDWWHHEEGLIDFQNEVIKLLYYLLKY